MLKVQVLNQEGKKVGDMDLIPEIFGVPIDPQIVQEVVVAQNANKRAAIAHTKIRSEKRGGGKKPWKQKGTGRARHGSSRSPLWTGGGVTFGPRNVRNFSKSVNKKMKTKALFMTLTDKLVEQNITVVDKIELKEKKTKGLTEVLKNIKNNGKKTLIVTPETDGDIIMTSRNIPEIKVIRADSLNVVDILNYENLLVVQDSMNVIETTYLK